MKPEGTWLYGTTICVDLGLIGIQCRCVEAPVGMRIFVFNSVCQACNQKSFCLSQSLVPNEVDQW